MSRRGRAAGVVLAGVLAAGVLAPVAGQPAAAVTLPSGFQEQIVFTGLSQPTNIEFASGGRVFVAEKGGRIKVFDSLADSTPTVFADLSSQVHNQWDRGLLGLALAPDFPTNPWVYVLYTYDAPPGQTAPVWNDVCPDANNGNCVVTGRLSRLQASGNQMTGSEQVLITDWCQQYPSHSTGDLHFGADGALYVSGGDGASFNAVDYGQFGTTRNPCGDPPGGVGGAMNPPTAEGGALRSQDVRSTADPTTLDGAILRLDPNTGAAMSGNPLIGSSDLNARRIVAHGVRNPFRFAIRPGTNEVWLGDVGWNTWEEVNRIVNPTAGVTNFGWPCYEGDGAMSSYDNANLNLCESLYSGAGQTAPYFTYNHGSKVVAGESCPSGGSAIAGAAFYPASGGPYPAAYAGALFFADYSRNCIWAMKPATAGGLPSTSAIETFGAGAAQPVDLAIGPGGELYYVDLGGSVRRIRYFPGNQPPTAVITTDNTTGSPPLTVNFGGTSSTDPDPADQGLLTYQWDFTNDGTVDATTPTATYTYTTAGTYTARLTVSDTLGVTGTTTVTITPGNSAPTAVIDTPAAGLTWQVGDAITFSGHATDPQQGTLPASALTWQLRLQHCYTLDSCHTHVLQNWTGAASGSFTAPDHEYPSYLELALTATDAEGLTHSVVRRLDPTTVTLTFASAPSGRQLTVGATTETTPFTRTLIQGSVTTVSAPTPQTAGSTTYTFQSWSDGGAQTHTITAPTAAATYTATYTGSGPGCADSFGYVCTTASRTFTPAGTVQPLNGDEDAEQVTLPFPVRLYGQQYTRVWVDVNGLLMFGTRTADTWENGPLPSAGEPNAAVYPFWDDLVVDAEASVRTQALGAAPNRRFVVEWRNLHPYGDTSTRVTFEAVLYENGDLAFNYANLDTATERGGSATVGIENAAGTVALAYSVNTASLTSGTAVLFAAPGVAHGTINGTATVAATGSPAGGATITLEPGGYAVPADSDGTYQITNVPPGSYTLKATGGTGCGTVVGQVPVTVTTGTTTANVAMTPAGDAFGYTCAVSAQPFITASGLLPIMGDEDAEQLTLPFAFRYYGQSYSSVWADANGLLMFGPRAADTWQNEAIPSPGPPNAAAYPYWDDLVVDGSGGVYTQTFGTAPNRYVVIEWRNVYFYGSPSQRVTFEAVLYENGDLAFNYAGLDTAAERGGSATVGIENADGTVGLQYTFNTPLALTNGTQVLYHPPS